MLLCTALTMATTTSSPSRSKRSGSNRHNIYIYTYIYSYIQMCCRIRVKLSPYNSILVQYVRIYIFTRGGSYATWSRTRPCVIAVYSWIWHHHQTITDLELILWHFNGINKATSLINVFALDSLYNSFLWVSKWKKVPIYIRISASILLMVYAWQ